MRIALVTDDGKTISPHFGQARQYLVFTVEQGQITARETREKGGCSHHTHQQSHEEASHFHLVESITDCEALIARGMGQRAYQAIQQNSIKPFITDIADAEEAVHAYLKGTLLNHLEKLH
jgi:predicted Fe-Mo cluster-binding NifX family protein